jgi:pheromone shutdown-related protein TraB
VPKVLRKLDDRLFLIGVAHVLPKSVAEVREVIERERPEVVAVELCRSRYLALTGRAERASASEVLRGGHLKLSLLSGLLYFLQKRFARQTGMPAGEEMLTAIQRAQEIGARVELIDRDINVTLQRLIDRMPWRERMRLLAELLLSFLPSKRVNLERVTDEQIVAQLLDELRRVSPTAYEVLIEERDRYMASRIAMLLSGGGRVACVVGAGHVPGIYERLSKGFSGSWSASIRYQVSG